MIYQETSDDHILLLNVEETDRFFDPFDPLDQSLASHLHHQRHRFIKEDVYEWLVGNVGEVSVEWSHFKSALDCRAFRFKDRDKAMLFKLTHG